MIRKIGATFRLSQREKTMNKRQTIKAAKRYWIQIKNGDLTHLKCKKNVKLKKNIGVCPFMNIYVFEERSSESIERDWELEKEVVVLAKTEEAAWEIARTYAYRTEDLRLDNTIPVEESNRLVLVADYF